MYINWIDTCIKRRVLTVCCCTGSGEGVMEDIKQNELLHEVDGNVFKNKRTYWLLL